MLYFYTNGHVNNIRLLYFTIMYSIQKLIRTLLQRYNSAEIIYALYDIIYWIFYYIGLSSSHFTIHKIVIYLFI